MLGEPLNPCGGHRRVVQGCACCSPRIIFMTDDRMRQIIISELEAELEHLMFNEDYFEDAPYYNRIYSQLQARYKKLTGHEYRIAE